MFFSLGSYLPLLEYELVGYIYIFTYIYIVWVVCGTSNKNMTVLPVQCLEIDNVRNGFA